MVSALTTVGPVNSNCLVLTSSWHGARPPPASRPRPILWSKAPARALRGRRLPARRICSLRISGLTAGTNYRFRVTAVDANGTPGAASPPISVTTPAATLGAAPGAPIRDNAAILPDAKGETQVIVTWAAPATIPDGYLVRYRATTGTAWRSAPAPIFALNTMITELPPGTGHESQVAAIANGAIGPWSPQPPATATTRVHNPRYADLIIWDGRNEVDVTRIQMLLFTVIAAGFVLLQIWRDNAIPEEFRPAS